MAKYTAEQEAYFKRMAKQNGMTVAEYKRRFEARRKADTEAIAEVAKEAASSGGPAAKYKKMPDGSFKRIN